MAHRTGRLTLVGLVVVLLSPMVARAGDHALWEVGGWGVGKIDGRLLLYLGPGRNLLTPIPPPPEGPRRDVAYSAALLGGTGLAVALAVMKRRRRFRRR